MAKKQPKDELLMLKERALSVKRRFLAMYKKANAGHIGSALSCTELLVFSRFAWMNKADRFVLSKGHAAGALYSILAEEGRLSAGEIDTFYAEGTRLPALPPFGAFDEIPFATGSLGYGLSICAGMALGSRFKKKSTRFFCVTSDGELNEGSVWEAALFIAHHRLKNVIWLIDRNKIQAIGRTEDVMALEPLSEKLAAFGFRVISVDGHDFDALLSARDECNSYLRENNQPVVLLADTVKGHGISFMENTVDCHYLPLDDNQYAQAVSELGRAYEESRGGHEDAF